MKKKTPDMKLRTIGLSPSHMYHVNDTTDPKLVPWKHDSFGKC